MGVPNVFGSATTSIPLSQLDQNFNTTATLGNAAIGLGNVTTTVGNLTLTNVNITSGTINAAVTQSGFTGNSVIYSNTSGNLTTSANMTFSGTALTLANDASISGLTVGKGGGAQGTNTALGTSALQGSNSGIADNVAVGYQAGYTNTTGGRNTTVGTQAFYTNLIGNYCTAIGWKTLNLSTADSNTGLGYTALLNNSTGTTNTAVGESPLQSNTTGSYNTALGAEALKANTTASNNTAVGYQAGYSNTTGAGISAFGWQTLYANTTGGNNAAYGNQALTTNTTGNNNAAFGFQGLATNSTGSYNTSVGMQALLNNTTASYNTAVGYQAGYNQTTGQLNTFVGAQAGYVATTGKGNTFIGVSQYGNGAGSAVTTGGSNTIIGGYNGNTGGLDIRTASNYIVLSDGDGNPRVYVDGSGYVYTTSNQINYATTATNYLASQASGSKIIVQAYNNGVQLTAGATSWVSASDLRLKNITGTYTNALADLAQIEPIKFTWKSDESNKPQVGVIAQSVQSVVPEAVDFILANKEDDTEYLGVRYTELIPLMIASIQELKAEVDSLKQQLGK